MTAIHDTRLRRLKRLAARISPPGTGACACVTARQLLSLLGHDYPAKSDPARLRLLQLDLKDLTVDGRIEVVNPGKRPQRYRRVGVDEDEIPLLWEYTLHQIQELVAEAIPQRQLNRLWERLLMDQDGAVLNASRLRVVPDTLRLQPVELDPRILMAVITALANHQALDVFYENARGERAEVRLHPQALVQRGPVPYLFALKNDEDQPVRLYALHRMIRASIATMVEARQADGFDLDEAIMNGRVDFGDGRWLDLELRARGYLAEILKVCPLESNQRWEDEPTGSDFEIRVYARVPATGQLLRWLLGVGDKVDVVAPPELRAVMASQITKMLAIYGHGFEGHDS